MKQIPGGALLPGGGWPGDPTPDGRSYTLREESKSGNWATGCEVFPLIRNLRCVYAWDDLQAQSMDDLPFIGSYSEIDGLTLVPGSWYGFALAPAIGNSVANHLAGLPAPELDQLGADRISRFDPGQVADFMTDQETQNVAE